LRNRRANLPLRSWLPALLTLSLLLFTPGSVQSLERPMMLAEEDGHGGGGYGGYSGTVMETAANSPQTELPLIVTYSRAPSEEDLAQLHELGGDVTAVLNDVSAYSVTMTAGSSMELQTNSNVELVAMDVPIIGALDVGSRRTGRHEIPRQLSWLSGAGVTVAVLDSGIDDHPDLARRVVASFDVIGAMERVAETDGTEMLDVSKTTYGITELTETTETTETASATDSLDADSTDSAARVGLALSDPYGHGTHVAGIIAASGESSKHAYTGVAPGARLVNVRVLDENGGGTTTGVIAGLEWVIANKNTYGIRVVSMSLGHPIFEPPAKDPLVLAVERAWEAGLVVVCSAGNWGTYGHFTVTSPGNSRRVITVGSLSPARRFRTT
jgi:hypothetical protein